MIYNAVILSKLVCTRFVLVIKGPQFTTRTKSVCCRHMQNSKMKATFLPHGVLSFFFFVLVISVLLPGCQADGCWDKPVGIADPKIIPDNSFTATSQKHLASAPKNARLNSTTFGWVPLTEDNPNDYLQIDLGKVFVLCAVATQGYADNKGRAWVTGYKITTSVDNNTWTTYPSDASPKVFPGNTDATTVVKNILNPSVRAKFIRFIPTTYNHYKMLRVEAYGFVADPIPCNDSVCLNGGTCHGKKDAYNCSCHHGYTGKHCGTTVNFCASEPCTNGGTCNNNYNKGYNCFCPYGFTGRQCETKTTSNFTTLMYTGAALLAVTVLVLIILLLVALKMAEKTSLLSSSCPPPSTGNSHTQNVED